MATLLVAVAAAGLLAWAPAGAALAGAVRTPPVPTTSAPRVEVDEVTGDLAEIVAAFVADAPRRGSGAYRTPTRVEASDLRRAIALVVGGQFEEGARLAQRRGYEVARFADSRTGAALAIMREDAAERQERGWPLIVLRLGGTRLHLQVPHPIHDIGTASVGLEVFDRTGAASLVIAGAHRDAMPDQSADVAHAARSIFTEAHRALVRRGDVVVQPHGFAAANHSYRYDVVVSSGRIGPASRAAAAIAGGLAEAGLRVCTFGAGRCDRLGATGNVQGRVAQAGGADFVHLEMDLPLRRAGSLRNAAIDGLVGGLQPGL